MAVRCGQANGFGILNNGGYGLAVHQGCHQHEGAFFNFDPPHRSHGGVTVEINDQDRIARAQFGKVTGLAVGHAGIGMHRSGIDPERPGGHVRVGNTFGVNQKKRAAAVSHQHPLPGFHGAAGVHTDPVAHAHRFDGLNLGRLQLDQLDIGCQDGKGFFKLSRISNIYQNMLYALFQNAEGGLGFRQTADFGDDIRALGDQVLQRNDGPVMALQDHALLPAQPYDFGFVNPAFNLIHHHVPAGNDVAVFANGLNPAQGFCLL